MSAPLIPRGKGPICLTPRLWGPSGGTAGLARRPLGRGLQAPRKLSAVLPVGSASPLISVPAPGKWENSTDLLGVSPVICGGFGEGRWTRSLMRFCPQTRVPRSGQVGLPGRRRGNACVLWTSSPFSFLGVMDEPVVQAGRRFCQGNSSYHLLGGVLTWEAGLGDDLRLVLGT